MIDLKDLSIEERTLVTIGCEPFYIGFKQTPQFIKIHDHLMQYFSPNHKKEVWVFITACTQALKHNMKGSLFSLMKANYTEANKKNKSNISYVKCKRVVETLHELGYITLYRGFYDASSNTSLKSCFIISDKLNALFNTVDFNRYGRPRPVETFVEIRDSKTDELIVSLSKLRGIKSERELVKKYNDHLSKFDIRCKSFPVCAVYKRVYTDDLSKHGRWYTQSCLQTTRSEYRKFLTINGTKTTEVDFKQMHPRLLLDIEGINKPMSWEPYTDISDLLNDKEGTQSRLLSKLAMMCLMNAKDLKSAKSALWKIYSEDKDTKFTSCSIVKGTNTINKIFERLINKNSCISHWFGKKDLWAVLQHYDSSIAAEVIKDFIAADKCILPWHDSFVCQSGDCDFLIESMRNAWLKVIGRNNNCFYDIEF